MKLFKLFFTIIFLINILSCKSQIQVPRIEVVQPTIEQETTSIWNTINDITFFEKQGYTINLPKDSLIDSLIMKSKKGTFSNEDFPAIYALVETSIFNQDNYSQAIKNVQNQVDLINSMVNEIESTKNQWDWDFKMFDKYKVFFTLYGTGGSYNPDEGTITLLTNKEGGFMNYKNPANTIIHEITHIGMEYSIIQKYNLSHRLKERVVDTFVYLMFQEKLPKYKIQNMGDDKINDYLKSRNDLDSLASIIKSINKG